MPRKSRNLHFDLPPLELRCMRALWAAGQATVHEIRARLLPDRPLAYTTVMTVMDRLARKGIVDRQKRGRAHLYRPAVSQETISEHVLNLFVENFFHGSRSELTRFLEKGGRAVHAATPVQSAPASRRTGIAVNLEKQPRIDQNMDTSLL